VSLILSFLIPLWNLTLTGLEKSGAAIYLGLDEQIVEGASAISVFEKVAVFGLDKFLLIVYLTGVFVLLIKAGLSIAYILRLRMWSKTERKENYVLVKIEKNYPVFSFFNMVFWNKDLTYEKEEADQILLHELVHVRQKHSLDILFIELINALLWFFPIAYWYKSSLKKIHEFIADAQLFEAENYKLKYVDLLMKEAQSKHNYTLPVAHTFFDDQLTSRLNMINNNNRKSSKLRLLAAVPLTFALLIFFSCNKDSSSAIPYESEALSNPMPGQIYQAVDFNTDGTITLKDGRIVTVDEMKEMVIEGRKAEGDIVTKEDVFIISKEEMKRNLKMVE